MIKISQKKISQKSRAIGLIILCTVFTSIAQIFLKFGSKLLVFDFFKIITNHYLIVGLASYGIGAILLIKSLKIEELTLIYPIIATSYIWVSVLSIFFLGENMNIYKWLGVTIILFGVTIIASKKEEKAFFELDPKEVIDHGY